MSHKSVFQRPVDMADRVKQYFALCVLKFCLRSGAAMTTVDHADIRGLDTACLFYVVELPLTRHRSSALLGLIL
jgi:hypothetical protein